MSVSSDLARVELTAGAGDVNFSGGAMLAFEANNLNVYQNGVLLSTAVWNLTLAAPTVLPSAFTVVLVSGATAGDKIIIERDIPRAQLVSYVAGGAFPAKSHEQGLDRLTLEVADARNSEGYSPRFAKTQTANRDIVYLDVPVGTTKIPAFTESGGVVTTGWVDAAAGGAFTFAAATDTLDITGAKVDDITPGLVGAIARGMDDRVKDWYTVNDFGADPTGIVDSSAAFQACNAVAGGNGFIYVPTGSYLIDATISVSNLIIGGGASLTINPTFTMTIQGSFIAPPKVKIFFSTGLAVIKDQRPCFPEWWGAIAGSGIDAEPAISACITAMDDNDAWMKLSESTYQLDSTLTITKSGLRITGSGSGPGSSRLAFNPTTGNGIVLDDADGFILEDLHVQPVSAASSAGAQILVQGSNVGSVFRNILFEDGFSQLTLTACTDTRIIGCTFLDANSDGIIVDVSTGGTAGNISISDCSFEIIPGVGSGVHIQSGRGISVTGCHFKGCLQGIALSPKSNDGQHQVSVTGCSFREGTYGIRFVVAGGHSSSIIGRGFVISGNTFDSQSTTGISVFPQNSGDQLWEGIVISGNSFIVLTTNRGIHFQAQDFYTITGNMFIGVSGTPLGIEIESLSLNGLVSGCHYTGFTVANQFLNASTSTIQEPRYLYRSISSFDVPSIAVNDNFETTRTVTGAVMGDLVLASVDTWVDEDVFIVGRVSAADTVKLLVHNDVSGAVDPPIGTLKIVVIQTGPFG